MIKIELLDFVNNTLASTFTFLKIVIGISILLFIFVFFAFVVIKLVIRFRRNKLISEEQNKLLHAGKLTAKKLRLRYLFTSEDGKKLVNIGKIVSFVKIKEGNEVYDVFITKKGFDEYRFYKVKPDRHSKLFADVVLYDWNFKLDAENKFMVLNTDKLDKDKVEKLSQEVGVDSIGLLSPLIHKAVQVNPLHRIQLRMTKLIKVPDEGITETTQQVIQYLTGGGQSG